MATIALDRPLHFPERDRQVGEKSPAEILEQLVTIDETETRFQELMASA